MAAVQAAAAAGFRVAVPIWKDGLDERITVAFGRVLDNTLSSKFRASSKQVIRRHRRAGSRPERGATAASATTPNGDERNLADAASIYSLSSRRSHHSHRTHLEDRLVRRATRLLPLPAQAYSNDAAVFLVRRAASMIVARFAVELEKHVRVSRFQGKLEAAMLARLLGGPPPLTFLAGRMLSLHTSSLDSLGRVPAEVKDYVGVHHRPGPVLLTNVGFRLGLHEARVDATPFHGQAGTPEMRRPWLPMLMTADSQHVLVRDPTDMAVANTIFVYPTAALLRTHTGSASAAASAIQPVARLAKHRLRVTDIVLVDERFVLSTARDHSVVLWDTLTWTAVSRFWVAALSVSPINQAAVLASGHIVTANETGTVYVLERPQPSKLARVGMLTVEESEVGARCFCVEAYRDDCFFAGYARGLILWKLVPIKDAVEGSDSVQGQVMRVFLTRGVVWRMLYHAPLATLVYQSGLVTQSGWVVTQRIAADAAESPVEDPSLAKDSAVVLDGEPWGGVGRFIPLGGSLVALPESNRFRVFDIASGAVLIKHERAAGTDNEDIEPAYGSFAVCLSPEQAEAPVAARSSTVVAAVPSPVAQDQSSSRPSSSSPGSIGGKLGRLFR